ncbi:MAG: hypothetical protein JST33_05125 [Actinobacteria bacterium]|nr:hypothetical protein [Actinomycetota bacterium]
MAQREELVDAVHRLADRDDPGIADDVEKRLEVRVVVLVRIERAEAMRVAAEPRGEVVRGALRRPQRPPVLS